MRTKFLFPIGLLGLVAVASAPVQAAVKTQLAAGTISMGGGFFGVPGTITADPALSLFVVSSSVTITDGYGVISGSTTNYINSDIGALLSPLAAGQSYSGEVDNTVLNGPGKFLFTTDYTVNPPPGPITSTGFLTLNYREGSNTAPIQTLTASFQTAAITPEPGALSLLASGLVGSSLFLLRRRRK